MYEIMGNGVILALITTKLLANVAFSVSNYQDAKISRPQDH